MECVSCFCSCFESRILHCQVLQNHPTSAERIWLSVQKSDVSLPKQRGKHAASGMTSLYDSDQIIKKIIPMWDVVYKGGVNYTGMSVSQELGR